MKYEKSKLDKKIDKKLGYKEGSKKDKKVDEDVIGMLKAGMSGKKIYRKITKK